MRLPRSLLALGLLMPLLAWAQTYPARAVTIVVPYPPGGVIDIVARFLAPRLGTELGPVVKRAGVSVD